MALGFSYAGGGDFIPSWRLNTISGDCVIVSSEKNASGDYEKKEVEVVFPAKFIFDFANLEVGWLAFTTSGPSFHLVKIGERMPEKPNDDHKQGFRVKLFSKQYGLSAFAATSRTISESLDGLHDQYLRAEKEHAGKVPVVEIKGTEKVAVKTKEGSKNFKKPVWSIVSWVDRPAELSESAEAPKAEPVADTSDDF